MQLTVLEYVQSILSSLGSDEVNSISDTTESRQVADILKTTYFNVINRAEFPEHRKLLQLTAPTDDTTPVLMYVPDGVGKIEWLKYFNASDTNQVGGSGHDINVDIENNSPTSELVPMGYQYVNIIPVTQFLDLTAGFNPAQSDTGSFDFTTGDGEVYSFYYKNNKQPQYCCVLSNYYVIFDGYDASIEDTLQSSKTQAYSLITPTWENIDTFKPIIDERQVPLLLNEAKSLAFFELKQQVHSKAEQESKRQWSSVQRDKSIVNRPTYFDALPDFGRAGRYVGTSYFKSRGWDRP